MKEQEKTELLSRWTAGAEHIRIVCHARPDGDAIGSGAALWHYLAHNLGKDAALLLPDAAPSYLDFALEGVRYTAGPEAASPLMEGCDLLFCLDFNTVSRTEALEASVRAFKGRKVLIDHHIAPVTGEFDLCFSCPEASSTCELLYFLLLDMPDVGGDPRRLPPLCARALMTGMTTDTNNFANSVRPETLEMASGLLGAGVDRPFILDRLYASGREARLRALGDVLRNRMIITPEGAAVTVLTGPVLEGYALQDGETEGFVNIPLEIGKVRLSIFVREEGGALRVSIRSKRGTSARALAVSSFHGGGHELAAGGRILMPKDIASAEQAEAFVLQTAARFLQEQDNTDTSK